MPSRSALNQFTAALPAPVRGALWMTFSALWLAALNGLIRLGAADLHPVQLAFFRCFFGLMFMLPWLLRTGPSALRTRRHGLFALRGLITALTMLGWFTAIALIPLADAVAISFTAPLLAVAGATVVFDEDVGWRRWTAIFAGFVGMLIVLRPGAAVFDAGALAALGVTFGIAATTLMIKSLSRTESPNAIVTYMVVYLTPLTLVPALFVWQWPPAALWPLLIGMGLFGTLGHICLTRALAAADASVVMPFDYLRLPFSALVGFALFAQVPDLWTWVGAGVIIGASAYVAQREAAQRRAAAARTLQAGKA